ncbi:hypothetical protein DKX38_000214 [Salix brachista]|uniref:Uncharacterized protein n=1 Tax=Salix brachista TaxID=2182728 RepID=A0A5N5P003_9ROSI|nr:hypothetical protein DKX38_000214 [Salix brachista]
MTKFLATSDHDIDYLLYDFAPYWLPDIATTGLGIPNAFFSIFLGAAVCFLKPQSLIEDRTEPEHFTVTPKSIPFPTTVRFKLFEILRETSYTSRSTCPAEHDGAGPDESGGMWTSMKDWLDKQEKGSVVYVAFGSEAKPSQVELTEIALGEENRVSNIPRDEFDGSFTRDSVAESLRLVMVKEEGKIYREKAMEMKGLFGNKDIQDQYTLWFKLVERRSWELLSNIHLYRYDVLASKKLIE